MACQAAGSATTSKHLLSSEFSRGSFALKKSVSLNPTLKSRSCGKLVVVRASGEDGRKPWDFGRFLQTVFFFNPPPSVEKVHFNKRCNFVFLMAL